MREEQKGFGLLLDACLLRGKVFVNKEQALFNLSEGMIVGQQIKVVSSGMGIGLLSSIVNVD